MVRLRTVLVGVIAILLCYAVALSIMMHNTIVVVDRGGRVGKIAQTAAPPSVNSLTASPTQTPAAATATRATTTSTPSPPTPQPSSKHTKSYGTGYTVSEGDHRAHAHPGGTEQEANRDRIQLEKTNRDALLAGEFWRLAWRAGAKQAAPPFPSALLATQERIEDGGRFSKLPLLTQAIRDCNNDEDLSDFACLIQSYEAQMLNSKSSSKQQQNSEFCRRTYGYGLIERFRSHKHDMCVPRSSSSSSSKKAVASRLICFSDKIAPDHTVETAICGGDNIRVDYSKMLDGDFPWLSFQPGAMQVQQCVENPESRLRHWSFIHCLRDWMELGYQRVEKFSPSLDCKNFDDDGNTEDAVVDFFVTRSGDYSPFALAHDWVNTVIAFAVANISRQHVRLSIMERMTVGFFTPMWNLAFSPRRPLQWFPDLRAAAARCPKAVSKRAFFNIPARLSPLYNNDECGASPLLRFTSDLIVSQVGAGAVSSPSSSGCFVVTFIVRRNYATGHAIERRIPNWRELVDALRKLLSVRSAGSVPVVVHAIDYADFDFAQQLNISRSTDLLIGMHGAGLIQSMFLPPFGGLFEFFCPDRPPGNNRYENLARRMGIAYSSLYIEDNSNRVQVADAVDAIGKLAKVVWGRKLHV